MAQRFEHDEAALQALAQGSQEAFSFLYDRYYDDVSRVANTYLKDSALAEDMVQEVFLKLWENRSNYCSVEQFKGYLLTMVRNQTLQTLKKLSREILTHKNYSLLRPAGSLSTEHKLQDEEYDQLINRVIENLPSQRKRVFQLVREEGLSYRAIAKELSLSQNSVRNHMSLAIKSIQESMSGHLYNVVLVIVAVLFF